jgi:NitT/TauT family transport system substrate-binding protein
MTFHRRCLLAGLALAAIAATPLAQAQKLTPLAVSYTATAEFGAAFIAKEEGFFAKRGLDVSLQLIPVSPNVPAAVMSNSMQIGGTTPPVLLQAVDSGLDLVAVAGGGVFDAPARPLGLVARTGLKIVTAQDLVGKKVGVPGFNASIHLMVRKWLLDKGVDPKRVTFIEVPFPQMPDVLKGGSVDVVASGVPFIGRMVQGGIGVEVPAFADDLQSGFSSVLYVSTRKWATENGAVVKAFREALAEAIAFGNANRDKAYDDIGKYFKVPTPVLRAMPWPKWTVTVDDAQLRFWVDTMRTQDMLKKQAVLSSTILK